MKHKSTHFYPAEIAEYPAVTPAICWGQERDSFMCPITLGNTMPLFTR